jgi:CBS domain-containing protein
MRNSDVNDVMTRDVVSIREFTPYKAAVRILMEHGVSALPVVDAGRRATPCPHPAGPGVHPRRFQAVTAKSRHA